MRTRNSYFPNNSNVPIPRRLNKGRAPNIVEPELRTIVEVAPMVERTMKELLRAPTEGYREAIGLPEINADHFEIKTNLLQLNVPNDVIKLMMFPYSLEGAAKTWMNATSSKTDERIDKLTDQLSTLVKIVSKKVVTPAPVKAVEETCVTCSGAHSWYNCPATDNNQASVCATTAKIPLNENCLVMLLKKLPEKLRDPDKFSLTSMPDPRVPLILETPFIETRSCFLIDVYREEITLRVDNEAVTFNLDQTTRYSSTNDKSVNRIDIIDAVCEEYAPEFLGLSNSSGGNPTSTSEPFTSEFILEEIKAYLKDDSISPEINHANCDPEEDICLIKKLLNYDPFQLSPMDLKQSEVTEAKSSIEDLRN
ncbi:hypothetical protein Tco_0471955 [Tanacetum coccineum]